MLAGVARPQQAPEFGFCGLAIPSDRGSRHTAFAGGRVGSKTVSKLPRTLGAFANVTLVAAHLCLLCFASLVPCARFPAFTACKAEIPDFVLVTAKLGIDVLAGAWTSFEPVAALLTRRPSDISR